MLLTSISSFSHNIFKRFLSQGCEVVIEWQRVKPPFQRAWLHSVTYFVYIFKQINKSQTILGNIYLFNYATSTYLIGSPCPFSPTVSSVGPPMEHYLCFPGKCQLKENIRIRDESNCNKTHLIISRMNLAQ